MVQAAVAAKPSTSWVAARSASRGKALVASGTASSAYGSRYTAWVYWNTLRVAVLPAPLASSSTATTLACCASSVTTPAPASATARRATPGGKAKVGRSRTPAARTGHSIGSVITRTPAVVPHASHASAAAGQRLRVVARALRGAREHQVRPHHHQRRQQRAESRPHQAPVRGEHAGEHDAHAVQHHLRGEHDEHPGRQRRGAVAAAHPRR